MGALKAAVDPALVLAAVVEASDDAVVVCDSEGTVSGWCSPAARIFDRDAASAVGLPLSSLFSEGWIPEVSSAVNRAAAGTPVRRREAEVARSDGLTVPVWVSIYPASGGDTPGESHAAALVAVVRDVTEQRMAQAALAEVQTRLEDSEALAHVGSFLWDLRTGAVQASAEFFGIHQVDPVDFDGSLGAFLEAIHPDDRAQFDRALHQAVQVGRPFEQQYRTAQVGEGGRHLIVLARVQPALGSTGEVIALQGIGRHQRP